MIIQVSLSLAEKCGIMNNIPEPLILFLICSGKSLGVRAVQALPRCNAKFIVSSLEEWDGINCYWS